MGKRERWVKGWLSSSKLHAGKAFCAFCDKILLPGKSEIIGHTKSIGHSKRTKEVHENCPMSLFVSIRDSWTIKEELNVVALIA